MQYAQKQQRFIYKTFPRRFNDIGNIKILLKIKSLIRRSRAVYVHISVAVTLYAIYTIQYNNIYAIYLLTNTNYLFSQISFRVYVSGSQVHKYPVTRWSRWPAAASRSAPTISRYIRGGACYTTSNKYTSYKLK